MEILSLGAFSGYILASIALAFFIFELFFGVGTFVLIWFGFGFLAVLICSIFYTFDLALVQVSLAFVFSVILLLIFRKKLLNYIRKSADKKIKDDFLNESGIGTFKEGKIYFKGTFWDYEPSNLKLNSKEKVKVISAKNNIVKIEKF